MSRSPHKRERLQAGHTFELDEATPVPLVGGIDPPGTGHAAGRRRRVLVTYSDTPDRRLAGAGLALWWSDGQWCLEGPTGTLAAAAGDRLTLPPSLAPFLPVVAGTAPLRRVLTADIDRHRAQLVADDGSVLEVEDDRVVGERLDDGSVSTWRTLRVVGTGTGTAPGAGPAGAGPTGAGPAVPKALRRALRRGGAPVPAAMGVEGTGPRPTGVRAAGATTSGATVTGAGATDPIARRLFTMTAELARAAAALRAGTPEGVHDVRTTVRRLRSCLRTFRPLVAAAPADHLRAELTWLGRLLGTARDAEVLAARFDAALERVDGAARLGPVRRDLVGGRTAVADAAREEALEWLASSRAAALVDDLHRFAAAPPWRAGRAAAPATLRRCLRRDLRRARRRARVAEALPDGVARDDALHRLRKAAKRVRDAADTLEPLDPGAARRMARRYHAVQDALGARQDAVVACRLLLAEGGRVGVRPAHNGFTYGVLYEAQGAAIAVADSRWPGAWRRASRPGARHLARG